MKAPRVLAVAAALALATLSPVVAAATPGTGEEMLKAFDEARRLMRDGKFEEAARRFRALVDLDPGAIGALLNLGECYERLGKNALAYERFAQAATEAAKRNDERAGEAHARAAKLEPVIARVVFAFSSQLNEHRPALVLDGEALAPATNVRVVDAGKHTLEIRFDAPAPAETRTIDAVGGATQTIVIEARTAVPLPPPPAGDDPTRRDEAAPNGDRQRFIGLGVAGVGVAGVVVGAVFGVITMSKKSKLDGACPSYPKCSDASFADAQSTYDSGHTAATVSTLGFIAGGVLLAGGAALYFTAPSSKAALSVSPTASGGLVDFSARF